jgi:hypothetical protein
MGLGVLCVSHTQKEEFQMNSLTVQLAAMFGLLATAAMADTFSYVSVTADVINAPAGLGCGGDAQGTTSVSISFACDFMATEYWGSQEIQVHEYYSGYAEAKTGVGPYGIGAILDVGANGKNDSYEPFRAAFALASFSWSQDVIVRGAQGSGDAVATISGFPSLLSNLTLFNVDSIGYGPFIIPITFGVPYTLSMSGYTSYCDGYPSEWCGQRDIFVSDLSFYADGYLVPDAYLEIVPEISSWLLLATCAIPTVISRLGRAGSSARLGR